MTYMTHQLCAQKSRSLEAGYKLSQYKSTSLNDIYNNTSRLFSNSFFVEVECGIYSVPGFPTSFLKNALMNSLIGSIVCSSIVCILWFLLKHLF
jgi:hypothetical protein